MILNQSFIVFCLCVHIATMFVIAIAAAEWLSQQSANKTNDKPSRLIVKQDTND